MSTRKTSAGRNPSRTRGRPKDPDKRMAVMSAAKRLFTRHGLVGTSMDAVAALAGVSKLTVYSHFENKEELFRQTIMEKCREHTPENYFDIRVERPLPQRLGLIAEGFFDLITSAEALDLYRLMASNPRGNRKLSQLFWESGPEPAIRLFMQLLEGAVAAGELRPLDPRLAASQFYCLVKGEYHLKMLLGALPEVTAAERRRHIDETVRLFLRAYASAPR